MHFRVIDNILFPNGLFVDTLTSIKGGFLSESAIRFSNLQNKNYPELEI